MDELETQQPDDEEAPYAAPNEVDILPSMDEQMQAFRERFWQLTKEAQVFGFTVVVGLGLDDPIHHETSFDYCTAGGYFACRGLVEHLREVLD